ncbi:hypothetical protein HPP92_004813 [Vanilla planifolia]|uniref:Uncharacterized protein n=1 Tax=Vanilla planifolia TaxID=51239 RepID=A0A835RLN1_VANPL|nr:hypothetical protein HPP92_004813 [Vanilla planifolia]
MVIFWVTRLRNCILLVVEEKVYPYRLCRPTKPAPSKPQAPSQGEAACPQPKDANQQPWEETKENGGEVDGSSPMETKATL